MKKNIEFYNFFYILRIDYIYDNTETAIYFYKEKPSIATIRYQINSGCSFKTAEEIYKYEPVDYEYDDMRITLQLIDINCFEKEITNIYDKYVSIDYESNEIIEFIKKFKQNYNNKLVILYNKLDTLLSIDELIFDWCVNIDMENKTIKDFTNYIKKNFKFKE